LRPALTRLDPEEGQAFTAELSRRIGPAYPASTHGVYFPFRRLFFVARRA